MMKLQKWNVTIAIICFVSGIFLAWNLRAQANNIKNNDQSKNEVLAVKVKKQMDDNKKIENDISNLKKQIEQVQKSQVQGQSNLKTYQSNLEKYRKLAGLTDIKGIGVVISLDDIEKNRFKEGSDDLLIHYEYLLLTVNALKTANAEAISINGQRIVTLSDIECGGTTILVNRTYQAPPYIITAIGSQNDLYSAVSNSQTYKYLEGGNFPVSITKKSNLTIAAYKGNFSFSYAKINKEGGK